MHGLLHYYYITKDKQELSSYKQDICVLFCQRNRIRLYKAISAMQYASISFTGESYFQLTIIIFIHTKSKQP